MVMFIRVSLRNHTGCKGISKQLGYSGKVGRLPMFAHVLPMFAHLLPMFAQGEFPRKLKRDSPAKDCYVSCQASRPRPTIRGITDLWGTS